MLFIKSVSSHSFRHISTQFSILNLARDGIHESPFNEHQFFFLVAIHSGGFPKPIPWISFSHVQLKRGGSLYLLIYYSNIA
jgi:hypothetical protein